MRICYFVQNHLAPPQVSRLVRTLRCAQPEAFVLVGHDAFAGQATVDEMRQALDADVFAIREPARRGYFSLLQPYFEAVEWLSDHGTEYDWIVYLSGQDYPTRPLASFETLLATSEDDGFLRFWDAAAPVNPWGRRRQGLCRYYFQYSDAPRWAFPALRPLRSLNGGQTWMHVHLVYGPRVGIRKKPPFGAGLTCYAGTQWTTLRRACAEYAAEQTRADGPLIRWFRRTICSDEAVVQTLLLNSGRFRFENDDLRYMDFTGSRNGRPRTLTAEDFPLLTSGPFYFARKFDLQRDTRVLDLLDETIGPT
ncbi:MAG TPA: beta-1,6-N-acetylglucosaminyltransferase [Thermoanaerobaculia bacterium]|nr:beta-1,6-N-acetylglucosaminyltransferase [Thermoanaerobaculia bacterium]